MRVDPRLLLDRLRISYKRRGRALWASCPLAHGGRDSDPSWSVVADGGEKDGAHWCHGCKQGGGPADLVAARLGLSIGDALAWLASGAVASESDLPSEVVLVVKLPRPAFALPAGAVLAPLDDWPGPARDYLLRRGVTASQAARWGLGYAVDGRLTMRVVVPIRDGRGRVVSYTARAFAGRGQRYYEPLEAEGPNRDALIGEHLWPAPARRTALLVAEGFFDAAALERAADLPVAALHGSNPTDLQLAKLATFPHVVHAVDPGAAGERLHERIRGAISRHSKVWAVRMTTGEDVAAFSERAGDSALRALVSQLAAFAKFAPAGADPDPGIRVGGLLA